MYFLVPEASPNRRRSSSIDLFERLVGSTIRLACANGANIVVHSYVRVPHQSLPVEP